MKLLVLNGPNLNFIGIREPNIYGKETYSDLCNFLNECVKDKNVELEIKQSNHEGFLVDFIHQGYFDKVDGIIINPGAYTHTSIALRDAIACCRIHVVEVHISDIAMREEFRRVSLLSDVCSHSIIGHGVDGYKQAVEWIIKKQ